METALVFRRETNKLLFKFDEADSLLYVTFKPDASFTKEETEKMLHEVQEFVGNRKHKALVDMGENYTAKNEGSKSYTNSDYIQNYRLADAFIVRSMSLRLLFNFYFNIAKPKIPTRSFTSVEKAKEWLSTIDN